MANRLRSAIVVSALVRVVQGQGGFATVVKKGEEQAGAIHILVREGGAACRHFGPASQAVYGDEHPSGRLFEERGIIADADLNAFVERESRFDTDFWLIELEPATPDLPFTVVKA